MMNDAPAINVPVPKSWLGMSKAYRGTAEGGIMTAVVAACAIITYADGWVTQVERQRMLGLLYRFDGTTSFGTWDVLAYFNELTDGFNDDHAAGERRAMAVIEQLQGVMPHADNLMRVCCLVAAADGGFDAEEREAAIRICELLLLDPADYDLLEAT